MDLGLLDKVAVVTGGTSGIGLATARLFMAEGAAVAICGRDEARLAAAKSSLLGNGVSGQLLAVQCDVLDKDAVGRLKDAVEQWMGRCDILVNNAGQARMSTFADTTDEAWREELELKFFSQIYPVRAFKPLSGQERCGGDPDRELAAGVSARALHGRHGGGARGRAEPGEIAGGRIRAAYPRQLGDAGA